MFALVAAVLLVVAAFRSPLWSPEFWALLGFAAWALHHAYAVALPALDRRTVR